MAELLRGAPIAAALTERLKSETEELRSRGCVPCLAVTGAGLRSADAAYEKNMGKLFESVGIVLRKEYLAADASQEKLLSVTDQLCADETVHGILLYRPLPGHLDEDSVCAALRPEKDVDGVTYRSMAAVFAGSELGFPPCTAQACLEILKYHNIDLTGKRVTVVGRSLVIGKPVSMMLLKENATVTVCHTRTLDLAAECRKADILIVAAGKRGLVGRECLSPGQIVIDVGINADENGNIRGDVDFETANSIVRALTPVPGGVGSVTAAVLASHVTEAARRTGICRSGI